MLRALWLYMYPSFQVGERVMRQREIGAKHKGFLYGEVVAIRHRPGYELPLYDVRWDDAPSVKQCLHCDASNESSKCSKKKHSFRYLAPLDTGYLPHGLEKSLPSVKEYTPPKEVTTFAALWA